MGSTKETLLDLAERCEKATGADRVLDAETHRVRTDGTVYDVLTPSGDVSDHVPAYTTSLDAAMTLVPEGWDWQAASQGEDGSYACVWRHGWHDDTVIHAYEAATPALALCAAALKARATEAGHVE